MGILTTTVASPAAVPSNPAIEALTTTLALEIRVSVASLRAFGNASFNTLVQTNKMFPGGAGAARLFRDPDGSAFSQLLFSSGGAPAGPVFDMAALPASGDVIIYWEYTAGVGRRYALRGAAGGATFGDGASLDAALPALNTGAGTGTLSFPRGVVDCVAVLNAPRTGDARFAEPLVGDADVVAIYDMSEDSGTTVADSKGGPAMNVNGAALSAGGVWNGVVAPPLVANELRFVSGTFPDPIVAGVVYELQVEAIDNTQGDARVTSFTGLVELGVDPAVPVGFEIDTGDVTQNAVLGVAVFPGIVFAATAPPEPGGPAVLSGPAALAAVAGRATFTGLVLTLT